MKLLTDRLKKRQNRNDFAFMLIPLHLIYSAAFSSVEAASGATVVSSAASAFLGARLRRVFLAGSAAAVADLP